jgi:hypothetical protein
MTPSAALPAISYPDCQTVVSAAKQQLVLANIRVQPHLEIDKI